MRFFFSIQEVPAYGLLNENANPPQERSRNRAQDRAADRDSDTDSHQYAKTKHIPKKSKVRYRKGM